MRSPEEEIDKLTAMLGEPGLTREKFNDFIERIKVLRSLIQEK